MRNDCCKKVLVVGIIVLFIGVGVQPAFANEVSITNTSEVEEDCNCNPVSNLHLIRLERMLNRLEIHTKILSLFSKYNPVIQEKFEELSNEVKDFSMMVDELTTALPVQDYPIICAILISIIDVGNAIFGILDILYRRWENNPILASIIISISYPFSFLMVYIWLSAEFKYGCYE